jgi:prepilin-type N-terminal cleavage/methylation domain-containing protein
MSQGRLERRGVTLIEVLVSVSIIAVLLGILLPAVQSAREAARRLKCQNSLRQIGIALHAYESLHGCYPGVALVTRRYAGPPYYYSDRYYSPLTQLLPQMEQTSLFHAVNFSLSPVWGTSLATNLTVMTTHLGEFLCPSDGTSTPPGYGRVNYRFNLGPTHLWAASELADSWSGPFTVHRAYRAADFRDGLSNTVGVSERLQGDWTKAAFRKSGDYFLTSLKADDVKSADEALEICRGAAAAPLQIESRGGESWFLSGFHFTCYSHCAPPNSNLPDCALRRGTDTIDDRANQDGVFKASSAHPGGVNLLLMDGAVRFGRDSISLNVWRSLATRASGEAVPGDW